MGEVHQGVFGLSCLPLSDHRRPFIRFWDESGEDVCKRPAIRGLDGLVDVYDRTRIEHAERGGAFSLYEKEKSTPRSLVKKSLFHERKKPGSSSIYRMWVNVNTLSTGTIL